MVLEASPPGFRSAGFDGATILMKSVANFGFVTGDRRRRFKTNSIPGVDRMFFSGNEKRAGCRCGPSAFGPAGNI
jgi:hypothetical protein